MSRSYNVEECELCDVGGGFVFAVCMCKTVEEYIHGMGYLQVGYLQEKFLQVVYLQYDQVCYVCHR